MLDYYGQWRNGTPTIISEIIHWDRPRGGHVFYVGTIGAGWAMQADVGLRRLMHNVLYHFGVNPEPAVPRPAQHIAWLSSPEPRPGWRSPPDVAVGDSGSTGSSTTKVVPPPGVSSTWMEPPCAWTICRVT